MLKKIFLLSALFIFFHIDSIYADTNAISLPQTYEDKNIYSINYPADWVHEIYNKKQPHSVSFMNKDEKILGTVYVGLAGVDKGSDLYTFLNSDEKKSTPEIKNQIFSKNYQDIQFLEEGLTSINNVKAHYFLASYKVDDAPYKIWAVAGLSGKQIVFIFMYSAPEDSYDQYYPIAKSMLESVKFS